MRLWSIHPKYLDSKGLTACWREGLLARHVLLGLTKGYQHHPQLLRFRAHRKPVLCLDSYLSRIFDEACLRGFSYDKSKIEYRRNSQMTVTLGQLHFEWSHLRDKLQKRDPERLKLLSRNRPEPHPCFKVIQGPIEDFERIRS